MELKSKYPIECAPGVSGKIVVALVGSLEIENGNVVAFNVGDCGANADKIDYEYSVCAMKRDDGSSFIYIVREPPGPEE